MLIVQPLHQAIPPGGSPPAFSRDFLCLLQRLSEGQLGLQGFGRVRVGQRGRGVGVVRGEDAPGEAGGADLDLGGPEGVVAEPQLPDDPAVVVVLLRVGEVVAVQVALETAVEPPATTVGRGAGTAFGRLVVVSVNGGEEVPVVGGEAVRRVASVVEDAKPVVVALGPDGETQVLSVGVVALEVPQVEADDRILAPHHPVYVIVAPPELPREVTEAELVVPPRLGEVVEGRPKHAPPLDHSPPSAGGFLVAVPVEVIMPVGVSLRVRVEVEDDPSAVSLT